MSKTLRDNVKAAMEEKVTNKRNELETKLENAIKAYNELIKKTTEDCESKFEPIIRQIVTNFFTNNPDIVVEDKTMYPGIITKESKVIKTKEDVQNKLITGLYSDFLLYLSVYTNSAQVKECKKALKELNEFINKTTEDTASTLATKIDKQQIKNILNKVIRE